MVSAQAGAKAIPPEDAPTAPRSGALADAAAGSPPPLDAQAVSAPPSESSGAPPVYLKQEGKVYLVRDWATVQRWIMERRVDREDLVSEGGVRWEPIGNRAELGSFFAAVEQLEANEQQAQAPVAEVSAPPFEAPRPSAPPPPNPFANPFPFGGSDDESASAGRFGRLDDDTEGVSMGLPPLPTEEEPGAPEEGVYPEQPAVRRAARMAEPSNVPSAEMEYGEPEPAYSPKADLARMRADTIPPDTAPPALPPTPAPLPRVEAAQMRPATPSALAMADTIIHEPDAAPEEDLHDDPFAGFGKPISAHDTAPVDNWEPEPEPAPRGMPGWLWPVLGLAATILVVGIGAIAIVMSQGAGTVEPPKAVIVDPEPELGTVIKAPEPEPEPVVAVDTDAPAVADVAAEAVPAEAPVAAPVEKPPTVAVDPAKPPPAEKAVSTPKLIEKGWAAVDRGDLAGAGTQFQKALGASPDNADANFGYGYVLLKQGQNDLAQKHLCRALKLTGAESDIGREASGLVTASGLSCP